MTSVMMKADLRRKPMATHHDVADQLYLVLRRSRRPVIQSGIDLECLYYSPVPYKDINCWQIWLTTVYEELLVLILRKDGSFHYSIFQHEPLDVDAKFEQQRMQKRNRGYTGCSSKCHELIQTQTDLIDDHRYRYRSVNHT